MAMSVGVRVKMGRMAEPISTDSVRAAMYPIRLGPSRP